MNETIKAVVAFAGARDGYQLPLALNEAGLLEAFVTDMYWPADRRWFSSTIGGMLPAHLLRARYCQGLNSRKVKISASACAMSACGNLFPVLKLNRLWDRKLGNQARLVALRHQAAIFCCSYYAFAAFNEASERPDQRFLFQLHPHPQSVRKMLLEEMEYTPMARSSLMAEPDLALPPRDFQELSDEPQLANGWVVASTFTAKTLSEHGVPFEHIHVVPYGVDGREFCSSVSPTERPKSFTIIFVGSLIQRKGLSYLLEAVRQLKSRNVRLLLCGRGMVDRDVLAHYSDLNIEVAINLSRADLVRRMQQSNLFIFPSLVEGFAHVILEAMSCGLPVIATPHTCAPDVIEQGKHGFIVPIRNSEAIAERLAWGMDNRAELAAMGEAAAAQARLFTWERFRVGVRDAYRKMIAAHHGEAVLLPPSQVAL